MHRLFDADIADVRAAGQRLTDDPPVLHPQALGLGAASVESKHRPVSHASSPGWPGVLAPSVLGPSTNPSAGRGAVGSYGRWIRPELRICRFVLGAQFPSAIRYAGPPNNLDDSKRSPHFAMACLPARGRRGPAGVVVGWWSGAGWLGLGEDGLDLDEDLDLVADDHTAAIHGDVGGDAEVLAVDLGGGGEAGAGEAVDVQGEGHLPGDAVEGQFAVDVVAVLAVADAGGAVGHGGVGVGLEEVGRAQVVVALGVVGVDGAEVDGGGDGGVEWVGCQAQLAFEAGEVAADLADHHVADGEGDVGVDGVDRPGSGDVAGDLDGGGRHSWFSLVCWFLLGVWLPLVTETMVGDHEGDRKMALQDALVTWREP